MTFEHAWALEPVRAFPGSLPGDRGASNPPGEGREGAGGMGRLRGAAFRPGTGKSEAAKERSQKQYMASGASWPAI
jgi:hypothetical protein